MLVELLIAFGRDSTLGTINPTRLYQFCRCSLAASLCYSTVKEKNSEVTDLSSLMKVLAALVES